MKPATQKKKHTKLGVRVETYRKIGRIAKLNHWTLTETVEVLADKFLRIPATTRVEVGAPGTDDRIEDRKAADQSDPGALHRLAQTG